MRTLENLEFQLDNREKWLRGAININYFHFVHYFWFFIETDKFLNDAIQKLVGTIKIDQKRLEEMYENGGQVGSTLEEQAGIGAFMIMESIKRAEEDVLKNPNKLTSPFKRFEQIAELYRDSDLNSVTEVFHEFFISPIIYYLKEQIHSRKVESYLLLKYKKKVEWFRKAELMQLFDDNSNKGEFILGMDLYHFLLDEGMSFKLESRSPSGLTDLYAWQEDGNRILAEVKVYNGSDSRGRNYVLAGYKQVRRYMTDYQESFGHLVVFNTTDHEFHLTGFSEIGDMPYIKYETTYVSISIIQLKDLPSASKRIKRTKIELTKEDFIEAKTK